MEDITTIPIRKLDDSATPKNYHAIKLQPSMKLSKSSTTITPADSLPNAPQYRRNSMAPKVFIMHDTKNGKTFKTMPVEQGSTAYRYVVLVHDGRELRYAECKLNKLIFASASTQEDVAVDLLEKQNRDRAKQIEKSLESRFKDIKADEVFGQGPVSMHINKSEAKGKFITFNERMESIAEEDGAGGNDEYSNKHSKNSRAEAGFGNDENAPDFDEDRFEDDDSVAEDEELDEDEGESKKLKKLMKEDSSDDEDDKANAAASAVGSSQNDDNMDDDVEGGGASSDEDKAASKKPVSGKKRSASSSAGAPEAKKMKGASGKAAPAPTSPAAPVAAAASSLASSSEKVTEADIRQVLMRHGKLTTKALLKKLDDKVKYLSVQEKNDFRLLVQRLCIVKKEGDERFLVLKDVKQ
eukprot:TRINITY_DN10444_c0_g1_i2.p1 TRINITY_DN10444_c0_g1~~TRINITY_DN10444_c0_g1_i2.p1  ORF type:complete len:411 (-),score=131.81 TRINITY_DN10444_c0_g1_i2:53-1285(-)